MELQDHWVGLQEQWSKTTGRRVPWDRLQETCPNRSHQCSIFLTSAFEPPPPTASSPGHRVQLRPAAGAELSAGGEAQAARAMNNQGLRRLNGDIIKSLELQLELPIACCH